MKAVTMNGPGGVEVLNYGDQPEPVPGANQVLVQVAVAGSTSWISALAAVA